MIKDFLEVWKGNVDAMFKLLQEVQTLFVEDLPWAIAFENYARSVQAWTAVSEDDSLIKLLLFEDPAFNQFQAGEKGENITSLNSQKQLFISAT